MATVSIADQLRFLVELQGLDAQIWRLQRELQAKPQEIADRKHQVQKILQQVQGLEGQVKTLEVKRNQMEMDLGDKENQIKKLQTQLFQVKTNKEYSAMTKEIEGFKADKSVLEEEILNFMEEIDRVKGHLGQERETLKAKESESTAEVARLEQESRQIQSSIQELQGQRSALIPKVDPPVLSRYERILQRKEGLALVPVRGDACGGCHMTLPPQMINEIQMGTRLIGCESCTRILYIEASS
jgi:predicted  nucleic acid-binding Zn-ribbon protein